MAASKSHQLQLINPSVENEHGDSESDILDSNRYVQVQRNLEEFYSMMQDFVIKEEFKMHIQKDGYDLDNIVENLRRGKTDVMKTECPIVFAGETSAGKSSIINLILGKKILPTDITASTSRVCRIKYSEGCMVCTCDQKDDKTEESSFENIEEMTEKLNVLAKTDNAEIRFVDIYMPVPILKGNVIIVDTPGCGDLGQKEVAEMMMSYLPNALAFLFVVNVPNAGGLQDDRLLRILSKVRNSLEEMVSFNPKDVIFLLNKWDTIAHVEKEKREKFFESAKQVIRKAWKEVDDSCIFQISAVKVSKKKKKYVEVFEEFMKTFGDVIARNENKRVKVHLRYLNEFLDEFNRVLSTKLLWARKNAEDIESTLNIFSAELENLEKTRIKEFLSTERIDIFFNEASTKLHGYIHHKDFKAAILKDTDKFTRFSIKQELDSRIKKQCDNWVNENLDDMFQKIIMDDLLQKFENIHKSLHSIKENLKGFQTQLDMSSKLATVINSANVPVRFNVGLVKDITWIMVLGFLTEGFLNRKNFVGPAGAGIVSGIFITGLVVYSFVHMDDFDTTSLKAFQARVDALKKEGIEHDLRECYFEVIQKTRSAFLEGSLEKEIATIKGNITTMRNMHEMLASENETLSSLHSTVTKQIEHLQQIGKLTISRIDN